MKQHGKLGTYKEEDDDQLGQKKYASVKYESSKTIQKQIRILGSF